MSLDAPAWDASVDEVELCFVDLEMTSLDPETGQICELCLIRTRGRRELGVLTSLVHADRGVGASATFHGIDDAMLASAPPFAALAPRVFEALDGAILVGHAVTHDAQFLAAELGRAGLAMPTAGEIDTLVLARRAFGFRSNKLGALAAELGIPMARAHRAEDDARATLALFFRLAEELAPASMRDLAEVRVGDRQPRPEVLARCEAAVGAAPISLRYRRSGRAAEDLSFCVTAVSRDVDGPKVHGYTMPQRARRILFAHRIVAVEPEAFPSGAVKDVR